MKNHIKNYIKMMGLAAVPFGTAQADECTIKVAHEEKSDAVYFKISVSGVIKPMETEIVWPYDREYPNPTLYPDLFLRCYDDETKKEARFRTPASPIESV